MCWGKLVGLASMGECRCRLPHRRLGPGMASSHNSCSEIFYESDLRQRLAVRMLAEATEVRPAETVRLAVELENLTDDPLGLVFRCRPTYDPRVYTDMVRVFDANGDDRSVEGITATVSGSPGDYLVVLTAHGKGHFGMRWPAVTIQGRMHGEETRFEAVPLPPGIYRLAFRLYFDDSYRLTEQQRLPSVPITVTSASPPGAASAGELLPAHGIEPRVQGPASLMVSRGEPHSGLQRPPSQARVVQSSSAIQCWPSAQAGQIAPPQSVSVSVPFREPSSHAGAGHRSLTHR